MTAQRQIWPHRPDEAKRWSQRISSRHAAEAFTLLEFIAVLAIITLIVTAVSVSLIQRLKRTARDAEILSMESVAGALQTNIIRSRAVAVPSGWPNAVAEELAVPVTRILQTPSGVSRVFMVDPSLRLGAASHPTRTLPYVQTVEGSVEPVSPRVLVISSIGETLPTISTQQASFNAIWNTPDKTVPGTWISWSGLAEDLNIQRLDLRTAFRRVVLNNVDPDDAAPYSIDSLTNLTTITPGGRVDAWFLTTTAINLHYANQSLQAREYLREDVSYVFENGKWSRYLNYGIRPPLSGFGLLAEQFRMCAPPPGNKFGANPQAVVEELFTYLYTYGMWATGNPPQTQPFDPGGSNSSQQVPSYQVLLDCQKRLTQISYNLVN